LDVLWRDAERAVRGSSDPLASVIGAQSALNLAIVAEDDGNFQLAEQALCDLDPWLESLRAVDPLLHAERDIQAVRLRIKMQATDESQRARSFAQQLKRSRQYGLVHLSAPMGLEVTEDLIEVSLWDDAAHELSLVSPEVQRGGCPAWSARIAKIRGQIERNLGQWSAAVDFFNQAIVTPGLGNADVGEYISVLGETLMAMEKRGQGSYDFDRLAKDAMDRIDVLTSPHSALTALLQLAAIGSALARIHRPLRPETWIRMGEFVEEIIPLGRSLTSRQLNTLLAFVEYTAGSGLSKTTALDVDPVWRDFMTGAEDEPETAEEAVRELIVNLWEVERLTSGRTRQLAVSANVEPVLLRIFRQHSEVLGPSALLELLELCRSCFAATFQKSTITRHLRSKNTSEERLERLLATRAVFDDAHRLQRIRVVGGPEDLSGDLPDHGISLPPFLAEIPSAGASWIYLSVRSVAGNTLWSWINQDGHVEAGLLDPESQRALETARRRLESWAPEPSEDDLRTLSNWRQNREARSGDLSLWAAHRAAVGPMVQDAELARRLALLAPQWMRDQLTPPDPRMWSTELAEFTSLLSKALPYGPLEACVEAEGPVQIFLGLDGVTTNLPWAMARLSDGRLLGEAASISILPSLPECRRLRGGRPVSLRDPGVPPIGAPVIKVEDPSGVLAPRPGGGIDFEALRSDLEANFPFAGCPGVLSLVTHIEWGGTATDPRPLLAMGQDSDGQIRLLDALAFVDGSRPLPTPDRVYLGGCAGMGLDRGEEWRGAALCFALAGARHVIAPQWSIFHNEGAKSLDREITELLRSSEDHRVADSRTPDMAVG